MPEGGFAVGVGELSGAKLADIADTTTNIPGVMYYLDSKFIPKNVQFPDRSLPLFNKLLGLLGEPPISNPEAFLDSLKNDVIVYYGDSIVYHPAAGINFNSK
jgi:hypothetical protein